MSTKHIQHEVIVTDLGTVTVSHIEVSIAFGAVVYHEVGVIDCRPLDLRKHKWTVLETYAEESRADATFRRTVEQVKAGEGIRALVAVAV